MKKTFLSVLAMTLALASCTREPMAETTGGEGLVTFTAELPAAIATKAYSNGQTAKKLSYYVYDEDNSSKNIEALNGTATFSDDLTTTVTLNLVAGKQYSIVFWADAYGQGEGAPEDRPYKYDAQTKVLSVTYGTEAQDENRDAFYVYEPKFKVTGPISKTITLKRPFAQINVGTSDYEVAKAAGLTVTQSKMTVVGVANSINLSDGTVEGNETAEFTSAAIPAGETFPVVIPGTDPAKPYDYLGMNYVLVGADKTTVDVTLTCDEPSSPMTFTQIPVQRNYRTNIFGALLTDPATFNVEIDNLYGEGDGNHYDQKTATVSTFAEANTALAEGATIVVISESPEEAETLNIPKAFAAGNNQTVSITLPATDKDITIVYDNQTQSAPKDIIVNANTTGKLSIITPESTVAISGSFGELEVETADETLIVGKDAEICILTVNKGAVVIQGKVKELVLGENAGNITWHVATAEDFKKAFGIEKVKEIVLEADLEFSEALILYHDLTVRGNGHELSNTVNRVLRIGAGNLDVRIYDTKLVSKCTASSDVRGISFDDVASDTKLLLDNSSISASFYAINIVAGPENLEITVNNGSVAGGWAAINSYSNNSVFNINNSILTGLNDKGESEWNDFATVVFDGYGFQNTGNLGKYGSGNVVNVSNSTIHSSSLSSNRQAALALQYGAQNNIIKIENTQLVDLEGNPAQDITIVPVVGGPNYIWYSPQSEIWIDGQLAYASAEAEIDGTKYKTIGEAFDAVGEGQTIKVLESIAYEHGLVFNKDINATLDLNGKTINIFNDTKANHRALRIDSGTLTVQNGTIDARNINAQGKPVAINTTGNDYTNGMYGTIRTQGGNAILKDLVLYNNHCWGMSVKPASGTITMDGCTLISEVGGGVEVAGGDMTISNCTFTQTGKSLKFPYVSCAVAVSGGAVANITNSTVSAEADTPLYIFNSGGTLNINGGKYEGRSGKVIQVDALASNAPESVANITGGEFIGSMGKSNTGKESIVISGGTFTVDPTAYLADGHAATEANGIWTVQ